MTGKHYNVICGLKVDQRPAPGLKSDRLVSIGVRFRIGLSARLVCECVCGAVLVVTEVNLKTGNTKSCGCRKREATARSARARLTTHGRTKTPEFATWQSMKDRCLNPRNHAFAHYGGRGITVCDRWQVSFAAFLEDMGNRPSSAHSLDRIDNNRGYSEENCRWATTGVQANNRRGCVMLEFYGKQRSVKEWSRVSLIGASMIRDRLTAGWPPKVAVWAPAGSRLTDLSWVSTKENKCVQ